MVNRGVGCILGTLASFLQIEFAVDYTKAVTPARPFYKSEWFAGET